MIRAGPLLELRGFMLPMVGGVAAALVLLTTVPVRGAQNPAPKNEEALSSPAAVNNGAAVTTPQQKEEPQKSNLEKTKTDAAELSALADQLRDELKKMNINVFSFKVIEETEKIEKLAKKIKEEANGH